MKKAFKISIDVFVMAENDEDAISQGMSLIDETDLQAYVEENVEFDHEILLPVFSIEELEEKDLQTALVLQQ